MKPNFIKSNEKKKILAELKERFGVENLPYLLIKSGKSKLRGYTGDLSKEQILELADVANIEAIGLYLINQEPVPRLSIDATHALKDQINKNILEINDEQFAKWIRGYDLDIKQEKAMVIIQYKKDFIGTGRSTGERIINYVPKERRIKN